MFVDTHAHLDSKRFDGDRKEVITRAEESGVELIINIGSDLETSRFSLELAFEYPFIYAAVGIHPHEAKDAEESFYEELKNLAGEGKVVAIGEIGLDYHYDFSPRDIQKKVFYRQINLAKELDLPIIVHCREAHKDTRKILEDEEAEKVVLHCFSGDPELAKYYLDKGYFISFAGPITFPNAKKAPSVVEITPLERLLVETDCPYMAPVPRRGKRNEPAYVRYVTEKVAQIKGLDLQTVASAVRDNTREIFGV